MPTATKARETKWYHRAWFTPAFCLAIGAVSAGALWAGGNARDAVIGFGVMAGLALVFAVGGRNETIRAMRGDGRDERWALIDVRATAFAGMVIIAILVGASFWQMAHGNSPEPFAPVLCAGAVAYGAAVGWLRRTS